MRNLEGAGWMTKPELSIIQAQDGGDPGLPYTFNLTVTLANPNAPKDSDGDGVPDQPAVAAAPTGMTPPATASSPASTAPATDAPVAPTPATHAAPATGGAAP
jgi:type IV pilus assembly protein PilN